VAPKILPYADQCWRLLGEARRRGRRILFEGAQAAMLDVDHGTYPYVTSSNTLAGQAAAGSGIGPSAVGFVLGITKAYTTRVGAGPFPTELHDDIGQTLGERGREFGTVTGRPRRCGWFDAVLLRRAVFTNSVAGLCLTKLDVLDGLPEIKICVGYRLDGKVQNTPPLLTDRFGECEPVYESVAGWSEPTAGATSFAALPKEAKAYLLRLEELAEVPIDIVSTGPSRDAVIMRRHPFD